jgi:hypothetical protein
MSPEQHRGRTQEVGAASDIWALGVILYELCTGRRPYLGESRGELSAAVINGPAPPRPRTLNPAIDRDLEAVILRCLELNPQQRFGTASLLAEELGRLRRHEPTQTRPASWSVRTVRWARSRSNVLVFAVLISLLGATLWLAPWYRDDPREFPPPPPAVPESFTVAQQPLQQELAAGKAVDLLDAAGMPRAMDKKEWDSPGSLSATNGMLTVHQDTGVTLLQLLTDPTCQSYDFTGEVRQEPCQRDGAAGVAVLGWERSTKLGEEHAFYALRFADYGNLLDHVTQPGTVKEHLDVYYWRRIGRPQFHYSVLEPSFPRGPARPGDFRSFRIAVSLEQIAVYWDGDLIHRMNPEATLPQARRRLRFEFDERDGVTDPRLARNLNNINQGVRVQNFRFREVIAIFADECAATFRNLRITPILGEKPVNNAHHKGP